MIGHNGQALRIMTNLVIGMVSCICSSTPLKLDVRFRRMKVENGSASDWSCDFDMRTPEFCFIRTTLLISRFNNGQYSIGLVEMLIHGVLVSRAVADNIKPSTPRFHEVPVL